MDKKLNILLVDDSTVIIERMLHLLNDVASISIIHTANNAFDGWKIFRNKLPHVAIIDINMPRKNGIELLKEIKQYNKLVYVIMITNEPLEVYKPICLENGANYFLDKSNEFEKLGSIITNIAAEI